MKLDYSGAKTIEEVRAIKNAFWDQMHQDLLDGKWRRITREEFDRQVSEIRQRNLKEKEQKNCKDNTTETPSDNAA
jgi:hypothetical protein